MYCCTKKNKFIYVDGLTYAKIFRTKTSSFSIVNSLGPGLLVFGKCYYSHVDL